MAEPTSAESAALLSSTDCFAPAQLASSGRMEAGQELRGRSAGRSEVRTSAAAVRVVPLVQERALGDSGSVKTKLESDLGRLWSLRSRVDWRDVKKLKTNSHWIKSQTKTKKRSSRQRTTQHVILEEILRVSPAGTQFLAPLSPRACADSSEVSELFGTSQDLS